MADKAYPRRPAAPSSKPGALPKSVKNAPPHLRAAIRLNQNKESAQRVRDRKRAEEKALQEKIRKNNEKLAELERRAQNLTDVLVKRQKRNAQAAARKGKPKVSGSGSGAGAKAGSG